MSSNPRHREVRALTLGFLSLGANAAPLDVLSAAANAGFGAVGLRISGRHPGDPWPQPDAEGDGLERVRARAEALSIRISSISGYYISEKTSLSHLLANVEAAHRTGAPLILQGCFEPDLARVSKLLRGYARAAADAGVRIALEFMPMSALKTIGDAQRVIADSDARNVGLLIDSLHLARSGADVAEVRALDPRSIYLTQLCDAPAVRAPDTTLFDEAMSGRMYLGDGGLDLKGLVAALSPDAEIELETPVVADAALPAAERARRAAEKAAAFFASHFG
ncbi:sugar phosphate isomerase/epimerase [Variovorax sp. YR216]|uniref:sugar phosphate isomerase/epimerase family protein n=1 Tax=Variovorax sp. YR216 TaxID=1882828 RepID=UPI0008962CB9|nr:TIM barrel protein [Variovorax sp. YR216]SEB18788.1 Sugar phosphate isomerase/epimerase [Variovorax sp. YR216]